MKVMVNLFFIALLLGLITMMAYPLYMVYTDTPVKQVKPIEKSETVAS